MHDSLCVGDRDEHLLSKLLARLAKKKVLDSVRDPALIYTVESAKRRYSNQAWASRFMHTHVYTMQKIPYIFIVHILVLFKIHVF